MSTYSAWSNVAVVPAYRQLNCLCKTIRYVELGYTDGWTQQLTAQATRNKINSMGNKHPVGQVAQSV
jgi:hypothetical protein